MFLWRFLSRIQNREKSMKYDSFICDLQIGTSFYCVIIIAKKKTQKVNCKITFLATNALSTMPTALLDPEIFLKTYPMFVLYNLFQIIGTSRKVKLEILQFKLCGWDLLSKCAWLSKVYIHKAFRAINGEEKNIFYKN